MQMSCFAHKDTSVVQVHARVQEGKVAVQMFDFPISALKQQHLLIVAKE